MRAEPVRKIEPRGTSYRVGTKKEDLHKAHRGISRKINQYYKLFGSISKEKPAAKSGEALR